MPLSSKVIALEGKTPESLLVRAAADGDRAAQAELFRRYIDMASGTAYRLLGNDMDLEDVLQDSFSAAFQSLERLKNPLAFGGWLRRIVVGTSIAVIRRRRLLRRLGLLRGAPSDAPEIATVDAPPDVVTELRLLYTRIKDLPTAERVVLVLHTVEQRTLLEIVEETGWSHSTVKRALRRARAQLDDSRLMSAREGGRDAN